MSSAGSIPWMRINLIFDLNFEHLDASCSKVTAMEAEADSGWSSAFVIKVWISYSGSRDSIAVLKVKYFPATSEEKITWSSSFEPYTDIHNKK